MTDQRFQNKDHQQGGGSRRFQGTIDQQAPRVGENNDQENSNKGRAKAMDSENKLPIIPSREIKAKVRMPRALFDHSRSIPTSRPIPRDTAIFAATSDGGNRGTNIRKAPALQRARQFSLIKPTP